MDCDTCIWQYGKIGRIIFLFPRRISWGLYLLVLTFARQRRLPFLGPRKICPKRNSSSMIPSFISERLWISHTDSLISLTHRIHACYIYIYIYVVDLYGKCSWKYIIHGSHGLQQQVKNWEICCNHFDPGALLRTWQEHARVETARSPAKSGSAVLKVWWFVEMYPLVNDHKAGWKMNLDWRFIPYWKWGFSSQLC